ncbi:tRNA (adenosine(37)-N6)-dimethylallyltransferase MiaA [Spirulina subsalsa FACHB-351]|uniref:tRNA dimethylallyltransferase n=1 Tax=Spirulina subsalsa FACHB-351 TaxID=234711 RepID=A0ABT3L997_9CYAN|nr:tRNA (adenosine(37)-N6)-dimethylallyltransferase MiaA [Spirulina subsalsa FACHB-351]
MLDRKPLIVICGATATGKSGLALEIAQRLGTGIISADSRQVYRELDIGTAKPTLEEQAAVPHFLIDICDPTETLTLADYQSQAQQVIEQVSLPLLVGGTGLYIKSITKGLKIPRVAPNEELRESLQALGQAQCYQFLQQVDPVAARKIHPNDQVRTLRSLEVFYITGKPISQQQGESPPPYPILQLGLDCPKDHLQQRIERRTRQMIEQGLVEEVAALGAKYGWDLPLLDTLGYSEMGQYVRGEISLAQAQELTVLHTRQFAKRQRTWFRANPDILWFGAEQTDLGQHIWDTIQTFLKTSGTPQFVKIN